MVGTDDESIHAPFGAVAPLPANEAARLRSLERYRVLDTGRDARFEALVAEIAQACDAPIATIAFLDATRQWFKAAIGLADQETPRDVAFCSHTILEPDRTMVVEDTTKDARFADNPLVLGDPRLMAYAGAPVVAPDGTVIGTVCAMDVEARTYTPDQIAALQRVAAQVMELLETTSAADRIVETDAGELLEIGPTPLLDADDAASSQVLALTRPLIEAIGEDVEVVTVVERFCAAVLEAFGWWAARVAWVQAHSLVPNRWIIDPSAPPVLERLGRSIGLPVELEDLAVSHPEPAVHDVGMLRWLVDRDVIAAVGGRHAVVLDVPVANALGARLVFVLPSSRGLGGSAARTLTTAAAILPRVIAQDRTRRELTYRATHDMLTGLLNREGLLDRYHASALDPRVRRAVLYLDLDGFKAVNDEFGHRAGDELLVHVGRQVSGRIRPSDTAVRLGGDEFLIVLDGIVEEDEAIRVARRLLRALCGVMTVFRTHRIELAVSIGVAMWGGGTSLHDAIDSADRLMYAAKELGGGAIGVESGGGRQLLGPEDSDERDLDAVLAGAIHVRVAPVLDRSGERRALRVAIDVEVRHPAVDDIVGLILSAVGSDLDSVGPLQLLLVPADELWATDGLVLRVVVALAAALPDVTVRIVLCAGPNCGPGVEQARLIHEAMGIGLVVGSFGTSACGLSLVDRIAPAGLELAREAIPGQDPALSPSVVVAALAVARRGGMCVLVPALSGDGLPPALDTEDDVVVLFVDHAATSEHRAQGSHRPGEGPGGGAGDRAALVQRAGRSADRRGERR